jgi:aryl-alcohol dehydrogenase-like predicted oxidoreductase
MAQLALAWILAKGEHIIPIPGTRHTDYVAENWGAIDIELGAETVNELDALINRHTVSGARYNDATQTEIDTEQFEEQTAD